jgi:hypothetical protein
MQLIRRGLLCPSARLPFDTQLRGVAWKKVDGWALSQAMTTE